MFQSSSLSIGKQSGKKSLGLGEVYAGNTYEISSDGTREGEGVEMGESGFSANPPVAPFIFVHPRARAPPCT